MSLCTWTFELPPDRKNQPTLWSIFDTIIGDLGISEEDVFGQYSNEFAAVPDLSSVPRDLLRPMFSAFYTTVKSSDEETNRATRCDHRDPAMTHNIQRAKQLLADVRVRISTSPDLWNILEHQKIDPDLRRSDTNGRITYTFCIDAESEGAEGTGARLCETVKVLNVLPQYFTSTDLGDAVIPLMEALLRSLDVSGSDSDVQRDRVKDVLYTLTAFGLTDHTVEEYKSQGDRQGGYIRATPGIPWEECRYDRLTPLSAMRDHWSQ